MSSSKAESDDLEMIRGIGPDARKWLAEAFDVHTFAALADLPEKRLINQIEADNKPSVWKRWAKDWPREAAKKAAEMEAAAEARQPGPASGRQTNDLPLMASGTEPSSPKPNNPAKTRDGWDTLGLYFVEFQSRQVPGRPVERQTKVVFEGPGSQAQKTLLGIEQDRICQWIFEHFDGILGAMPATETLPGAETTPSEIGPSAISVSELRLFQPADAGSPLFSYSSKQPKLSVVRADQAFNLEAILEESQPLASINGRIAFNVQFHVKNWDTREFTSLGTAEPKAIEDHPAYSALLPGISLPRGKYRLEVLVLAHPKPVALGSIEIPLLSVW